jgi:hypothetical protein
MPNSYVILSSEAEHKKYRNEYTWSMKKVKIIVYYCFSILNEYIQSYDL